MRIGVVAVGKLRPHFRAACDDYFGRLAHYATVDEREVRDASTLPTAPARRAEEAKRIADKLPAGGVTVALARDGKLWTSAELATRVKRWQVGAKPVTFVIGGSDGLDDAFIAEAAERWSLGPLTLPHELARVVVLEQVYRAFTIVRGEKYHKGR